MVMSSRTFLGVSLVEAAVFGLCVYEGLSGVGSAWIAIDLLKSFSCNIVKELAMDF